LYWRPIVPGLNDRANHLQAAVAGAPAIAEVEPEIVAALKDADVVVGHQVRVDLDVLTRSLPTWTPPRTLDTLRLAKTVRPGMASYRLGTLADELCLRDVDDRLHRAVGDARLTARLMLALMASRTAHGHHPTVSEVMAWAASGPAIPGQPQLEW
jgi:DNA polymerase III epsilon subunit-like protein